MIGPAVLVAALIAGAPGPAAAAAPAGDESAAEPAEFRAVRAPAVREVRDDFEIETAKADRGIWAWGAVGFVSASYAVVALAGGGGDQPVLKSLSIIVALAGGIGVATSARRAHTIGALRDEFDSGLHEAGDSAEVRLPEGVVSAAGRELHDRLDRIRRATRGALRAGCVLPVLLGGIGVYGLTVSSSGGDNLAGVGLGGALVIGAPAMLSYFGLQERLKRTEGLVARWDEALLGQEKTQ